MNFSIHDGCNKVVIVNLSQEILSEIILVISNQTRTACLFNFEITCVISAYNALYSVQLPLLIHGAHRANQYAQEVMQKFQE